MIAGSGARTVELTGSPFHTTAGLYPVRALLQRAAESNATPAPLNGSGFWKPTSSN